MSDHLRRMKNTIPIQEIPSDEWLDYLNGLPPRCIRWAIADAAELASVCGDDATFWLIQALAQAGDNAAATDLQTVRSDAQEDISSLAPVVVELLKTRQTVGGAA